MSSPYIPTEVKVIRIGSEDVQSASGRATILWNLKLTLNNNMDGLDIKIDVPEQNVVLNLEYWDDETDKDISITQTIKLKNIRLDDGRQDYRSFVKNLQNGLKPQQLEIWRDTITLSF